MALIKGLASQKVKVIISLFGQQTQISGKLTHYEKPFIEIVVCGVTRIFNENAVKEIIPVE
jgi:hypothetical protein